MTDNSQDKNTEAHNDNPQTNPDIPAETKERYLQQIEGWKKEAQKFRELALESEIKRAEVDSSSIIELHDKDPKMANEVAQSFWYSDFNEVKTSLETDTDDDTDSDKDKFNQWYKEKQAKEESSNAHSEADKILNTLEWDIWAEAKKYYKSMTDGRDVTVEQATEFAKMATLYVNKDNLKSDKLQEWILNFGNTWLWTSSKPATKKNDWKNKEFWTQVFGGKFAHLYK